MSIYRNPSFTPGPGPVLGLVEALLVRALVAQPWFWAGVARRALVVHVRDEEQRYDADPEAGDWYEPLDLDDRVWLGPEPIELEPTEWWGIDEDDVDPAQPRHGSAARASRRDYQAADGTWRPTSRYHGAVKAHPARKPAKRWTRAFVRAEEVAC